MTIFQEAVTGRLKETACHFGLDLRFEDTDTLAVARFEYQSEERLILVCDGQLILEWEGEQYFEVPEDPTNVEVLRFVELFRLCLSGLPVNEARREARLYVVPAR